MSTPPQPFDYPTKTVSVPTTNHVYQVIDVSPSDVETPKGTLLLVHGFPDLSFGWRYQIPKFLKMGWRVICPDMLGYGGTSKPSEPEPYAYKNLCRDLKELLDQLEIPKIFLVGHDWGGAIVWRFGQYYPSIVTGVTVVCTPYFVPPSPEQPFVPEEIMIRKFLPNFGYQLFFKSDSAPKLMESRILGFLGPMFSKERSKNPNPEGTWALEGKLQKSLEKLEEKDLGGWNDVEKLEVETKDPELFWYLKQFRQAGFRGPTNYYRTREINHQYEQSLSAIYPNVPCLLIVPKGDAALPPSMTNTDSVWKCFKDNQLEVEVMDGDHWVLQDSRYRDSVGDILTGWIDRVLKGDWKPDENHQVVSRKKLTDATEESAKSRL